MALHHDGLPGEIPDAWVDECLRRLGRDVPENPASVATAFAGAGTVVVTGGGGSLGSRIARAAAFGGAAGVVLVDRCGSRLSHVRRCWESAGKPAPARAHFVLADVALPGSMNPVLRTAVPPVWVVHAAALKDVVQGERSVVEAFRANVLGTEAVLAAAAEYGAARVLAVSTDKAADPAGVLGFTKWIAEGCVRRHAASGLPVKALRLGNVLGSRNSVLPRWAGAARHGRPWPLTDPLCRRFALAPREAAAWMARALEDGPEGPVLVPDLPPPVSLMQLARAFAGVVPDMKGEEPRWRILGLRPGEKRVEVLAGRGERLGPVAASGLRSVRTPGDAFGADFLAEVREAVAAGDARTLRSLVERSLPGPEPSPGAQGARRAPM